jgi:hypothetical protein
MGHHVVQPAQRRFHPLPWAFSALCLVTGVVAGLDGARLEAVILLAGVMLHGIMVITRREPNQLSLVDHPRV